MALSAEARAEWIVARLEDGRLLDGSVPPGATAEERAELVREAAECREIWRALEELDGPVASEAPSPAVHRAFQATLAEAISAERTRTAVRFRRSGIPGWARRSKAAIAASLAVAGILALALWRSALWSPRGLSPEGRVEGAGRSAGRSASTRLGGVLAESGGGGAAAVEELDRILRHDPNPNVRLAALEVLSRRFARTALEGRIGRALAEESDPLVRLELIRAIGERGLDRDGRTLRELALDPRLDDLARDEIERVRARLGP